MYYIVDNPIKRQIIFQQNYIIRIFIKNEKVYSVKLEINIS